MTNNSNGENNVKSITNTTEPDGLESQLKIEVVDELNKLGSGGPWLWKLFFLCAIPNILNGFHISSYVFLSTMPNRYWCSVPDLEKSNWTPNQIRNITTSDDAKQTCTIKNYDYSKIKEMSFEDALNYTSSQSNIAEISCLEQSNTNHYHYEQEEGRSIVPEWDLVCENKAWRSTVQVALSLGKFLGASIFGVISDRYGRKRSYVIGSMFYIVGGFLTALAPWYWLFMIGRMMLGAAGAAIFYSSYTLLSENVHTKHRSWMCLAHSISYPLGMLFLAGAAYFIQPWRYLQLALSIPSLIMCLFCYFVHESPRWLISKGREAEAYKILFGKEPNLDLVAKNEAYKTPADKGESNHESVGIKTKVKNAMNELIQLYGPSRVRNRVLICHFNWCVISMSYYITALNADNFAANRYAYVAITGMVDAPAYVCSIVFCRYMGRKMTCCILFLIAGLSLLVVLVLPRDSVGWIVFFAMFGRFGISAVYAVMTLHTSEMFPTEIRNSALGTSSTCAHVGSITAPYIVDLLGMIAWFIPTTICGTTILLACLLTFLLPETKNKNLKDHVEDEIIGDNVEMNSEKNNDKNNRH